MPATLDPEQRRLLEQAHAVNVQLLDAARQRGDVQAVARLTERVERCRQLLSGEESAPRRRRRR